MMEVVGFGARIGGDCQKGSVRAAGTDAWGGEKKGKEMQKYSELVLNVVLEQPVSLVL